MKFGIIGAGGMAVSHSEVIINMGHKIHAVAGRRNSKRLRDFTSKFKVRNRYTDYKDLLKNHKNEIDGLIVAVSWDQTEKIIQDILTYGIPCLIEKPVTLRLKSMQRISKKFGKKRNILVGYNRRFYDFIPQLKNMLRKKSPVSIDVILPEPYTQLTRNYGKNIGKHVLMNLSSHAFDLLNYLTGKTEVKTLYKKKNRKGDITSLNGILYSNKMKCPIMLSSNFDTPVNTTIRFNFDNEIIELRPLERMEIYKGMEIKVNKKKNIRSYVPKSLRILKTSNKFKPGIQAQMKNFISTCIRNTKKNTSGCSLNDALETSRLCETLTRWK